MRHVRSKFQALLYCVFLVSCVGAFALGLLKIWGSESSIFLGRVFLTCVLVAVVSAFTMSATRLVAGRPPEDGHG